ncbi:transglutaminase-like domain-containing protein [Nocardioides hankookensis]|uniref:Transglutaminase family protein n=1 Tax=Nocardioides hankookensis TaxID=443157 RepID=A0ABW1LMW4_9ACTN
MTAVHLDISSDRLADAGSPTGKVSDIFTDLPDDLPPIVHDLAVQVTDGAETPYEKAVALQNWFREDGGFTYSLAQGPDGNGSDALVEFLSDGPGGRVGYCEQFASAMAVMARQLGIPARVAIGFLHPDPDGPNQWVYSSKDMHAWPELYFDGAGWVRFEPTPAGRADEVPSYTEPGSDPQDEPTDEPSASQSSSAPTQPNRPRDTESAAAAADDQSSGGSSVPWIPTLGGLAVLLLVAGGLLLPRTLRARRRERRLASGLAEPVWAELRDTAVDLGLPWPRDRSPRATRAVLVEYFGAPVGPDTVERPAHGPAIAPEAVGAIDRLVHTVELDRYSRSGASLDPVRLRADGETCVAALFGGAARSARRRATWWPPSLTSAGRAPQYRLPSSIRVPGSSPEKSDRLQRVP